MNTDFKSTHELAFETAPYHIQLIENVEWKRFRIGTCYGLWCSTPTSYDILSIVNNKPGNGHLTDVIEWFERSCSRDKRNFRILETWNEGFKKHLITKRGFTEYENNFLVKHFSKCNQGTTPERSVATEDQSEN